MEIVVISVFVGLMALLALCAGCVAILRRRPGLRRRKEDPNYSGPPRRFTDPDSEVQEAIEDVFAPDQSATEDEERVKMNSTTRYESGK